MSAKMRWGLYAVVGIVMLPALAMAAWVWITLHFSYSTGERAGVLQKISSKGWVCKSWEGEIAMPTQPGVPPQIFPFSVRDETVAKQLLQAAGQKVSLSYEQHRGVPTTCFGETEYYVTQVRTIP